MSLDDLPITQRGIGTEPVVQRDRVHPALRHGTKPRGNSPTSDRLPRGDAGPMDGTA